MTKQTTFEDDFSKEVWETTYKDHNDNNVDDTFRRVAKAVASVEKNSQLREEWEEKFYDMLSEFKITTGGRIYSNAGTEFTGTTLANCFVGTKPKQDQDSLDGILEVLRAQAKTLKSEGGWGMNFSFIRPRGAFIHGIGVETPGAVKYMELFDKSSDIITAGSGSKSKNKKAKGKIRKGAMMGVLSVWHPDIVEFIEAKLTDGRLTKFNISVNCTNDFMDKVIQAKKLKIESEENPEKVKEFEESNIWELIFPETTHEKYKKEWDGNIATWKNKGYPVNVYRTIGVLELWDKIIKSTYTRNDPGVLFCDIGNKTHCWNYGKNSDIQATNPCFHGDTMVAVADGRNAVTIKQLAEEGKDVPVYTVSPITGMVEIKWGRNPRVTGYDKELLEIKFSDGTDVKVTPDHRFLLMNGDTKEAKDLIFGDSIPSFTKRAEPIVKNKNKLYYRVHCDTNNHNKNKVFEHRLISKFHQPEKWDSIYNEGKKDGWIKGGLVIHHKDYNGLNNSIENLEIMRFKDHNKFHAEHDFKGENNPMFGKKHSEETKNKIGAETKKRNENSEYRSTWINKINESFTDERKSKISTHRTIFELNRRMDLAAKTGLKAFLIDGELMVEKTCEFTNTKFVVPWNRREVCLNPSINPMEIEELKDKCKQNLKNAFTEKAKINLHNQIMIYKDLQEKLERTPSKKEWENECKLKKVSFRFNSSSENPYILKGYKDFQNHSLNYNHRIVGINKVKGLHTVYNITTEDNHTVGIINNVESNTYKGIFTFQCGEQLLPFGGICNLASVNLTQFINKDRTDFDHKKLQKYLPILTRFSDNVNDYSNAPLDEYIDSMRNRRRIGLGVSGWGSALYLLKTRFASEEAETIKARMMKTFTHTVVKTSIELAKEKGMFKECDPAKHASASFWKQINLPQDLIDDIEKYGIRNSALFSIQPTGNTSILANIISGGLEPLFLSEYIRTVIVPSCPEDFKEFVPKYWEGEFKENQYFKLHKEGNDDILKYKHTDGILYKIDKNRGLTKEVLCEDYAVRHLKKTDEWNPDADWAVTTMSLSVDEHVADMSGWGKWIDSSMSKTVNVPNDYPFDKFENLYLDTYKTGYLKGITTYRAGTMTNVLAAKTIESSETGCKVCKREKDLIGDIYHTNAKGVSYFVIVGLDKNGLPYEIFAGKNGFFPKSIETGTIHKVKRGLYQLLGENDNVVIESITEHLEEEEEALTRMISMSLRHGVDINYVVHQLEKVKGALNSLSKCMSRCLKKYIKNGTAVSGEECPSCGKETLIRAEGCKKCMNCSNSICG